MARVLLSAFACDPDFGSDEEVGWQWAKELCKRGHHVTVLTRASHQRAIEARLAQSDECNTVKFVYFDLPRIHAVLSKINRRNHLYYYLWQWFAYQHVKTMHQQLAFDLVHHVTWVSFRQPSFMGGLGIPLYFGPVAGGDEIPPGYSRIFSRNQRLVEILRGLLNRCVAFDPMMRMTFRDAKRVFFTSDGHLARVPPFVANKAQVELAIGCNASDLARLAPLARRASAEATRLIFVGRCIGLKGMDLGLRSFALILQQKPSVRLTIIGDGVDRQRWEQTAQDLGISHAIEWLGWLPKAEVLAMYTDYDALFYPSLRDSGGFVVLEALQAGLPVICYRLGGPGVVIDHSCGAAVVADINQERAVQNFADATISVLSRLETDPNFAQQCRQRVSQFTWDALIDRIYVPIIKEIGQ
ncbi:glycosyltransferase family 4 protein [Chitinibacter bivalviorum]|uniref:Glycosyltransferase family 4 protein n=1 Tax=Chitinibacter bivalviorum TaxID=2739434 RepID=A0A7H9BLD1_9NEIS|nr:glycosyltransferase family 4 protein [Chitinibacter bivalviorum]QLG88214.1 glycosyltransferase family 4 protein [Chitinibacter bivalviorum]